MNLDFLIYVLLLSTIKNSENRSQNSLNLDFPIYNVLFLLTIKKSENNNEMSSICCSYFHENENHLFQHQLLRNHPYSYKYVLHRQNGFWKL